MTAAQYEAVLIAAEALARARFGETATGQAARVIPEDEHRKAVGALLTLLKEDTGEPDPLPSVSWRAGGNFGDWHRQAEPDLTRCGIRVPVLTAIVGYGIATNVRPVDGCRRCWPDEKVAATAVDYEIVPAESHP
jgi:hypothetical protein